VKILSPKRGKDGDNAPPPSLLPPDPIKCHNNARKGYEKAKGHEQDWHQMPFVLHVHPVTQLNEYLKNSHHEQNNKHKGYVDPSGRSSRKRNQRENNGENKHHDVFLWSFRPVTVFHRLLICLILS